MSVVKQLLCKKRSTLALPKWLQWHSVTVFEMHFLCVHLSSADEAFGSLPSVYICSYAPPLTSTSLCALLHCDGCLFWSLLHFSVLLFAWGFNEGICRYWTQGVGNVYQVCNCWVPSLLSSLNCASQSVVLEPPLARDSLRTVQRTSK
jgi:hypothetical protein